MGWNNHNWQCNKYVWICSPLWFYWCNWNVHNQIIWAKSDDTVAIAIKIERGKNDNDGWWIRNVWKTLKSVCKWSLLLESFNNTTNHHHHHHICSQTLHSQSTRWKKRTTCFMCLVLCVQTTFFSERKHIQWFSTTFTSLGEKLSSHSNWRKGGCFNQSNEPLLKYSI